MVHELYRGDINAGEECSKGDVKALGAYRIKDAAGGYRIVLAGSEAEARAAAGLGPKDTKST